MSQEKQFDWQPISSPTFGNVFRPTLPIEVESNSGEWKVFYPEVDSGAIISVFNKCDCELLGYELQNGRKFTLQSVLGGGIDAYIHTVNLKIGNDILNVKIAFTDGKNHKQLLGRIDVFDKLKICLSGKNLKTSITIE